MKLSWIESENGIIVLKEKLLEKVTSVSLESGSGRKKGESFQAKGKQLAEEAHQLRRI